MEAIRQLSVVSHQLAALKKARERAYHFVRLLGQILILLSVLGEENDNSPITLYSGRMPATAMLRCMEPMTVLYRPVGQREYQLIVESGFRRFPPRLPEQPYFYPVANEEYAAQIARDWNTRDAFSGFIGYVVRFQIATAFLARYRVRTVGSSIHQEYWIPAEELEAFNDQIRGLIERIATFP